MGYADVSYGVILCVGGLARFGYLSAIFHFACFGSGAAIADVMAGVLSAIVDNIPEMSAVLAMNPEMSHG